MTIRSRLFASATVAMALSLAGAAQAAEYELQFIGADVSGDVLANTSGANVTSISGWVSDSEVGAGTFSITGLSPYAASDNAFSATSPYVDFGGLSFATATGGSYNLADIGSAGASQLVLLSSVLDPRRRRADRRPDGHRADRDRRARALDARADDGRRACHARPEAPPQRGLNAVPGGRFERRRPTGRLFHGFRKLVAAVQRSICTE